MYITLKYDKHNLSLINLKECADSIRNIFENNLYLNSDTFLRNN